MGKNHSVAGLAWAGVMGYSEAMNETTWENVGKHYTSNGVEITPGLRIRNYDYREDTVIKPSKYGNPNEPQWFITEKGVFDGSRMIAL